MDLWTFPFDKPGNRPILWSTQRGLESIAGPNKGDGMKYGAKYGAGMVLACVGGFVIGAAGGLAGIIGLVMFGVGLFFIIDNAMSM